MRVLSNTHHTFVQLNKALAPLPVDQDGNVVAEDSEAFQKWHEEASSITIGQLLSDSFPNLFMETLSDEGDETTIECAQSNMEVVSHGVAVDLNTQMYWMQMNMCYPDGFIYLSFHYKS